MCPALQPASIGKFACLFTAMLGTLNYFSISREILLERNKWHLTNTRPNAAICSFNSNYFLV